MLLNVSLTFLKLYGDVFPQRVLMYEPAFAARIVNACAVLHNMRIQHRLPLEEFEELIAINQNSNAGLIGTVDHNGNADFIDVEEDLAQRGPRVVAQRIQRQIMQERFPNFRDAEERAQDE